MPSSSKKPKSHLALFAAFALISISLIGLLRQPQTLQYEDIVLCFQQRKVKEYRLDLNTGRLVITKMEGLKPGETISHRIPQVEEFLDDIGRSMPERSQRS